MNPFPYKELTQVLKFPFLLIAICWIIFLVNFIFDLNFYQFGISPRKLSGLIGVLVAPILHVELNHLLNNTIPVFILTTTLFYFYKSIAWPVFLWIYFISDIWLWIGGRNNDITPHYHFGASILIYGLFTFIFLSGILRKHQQLMVVSAIVVFFYGSITWGVLPSNDSISWEGHLFASICGALTAYYYKSEGPQKKEYQWEEYEDNDLEDLQTNIEILNKKIDQID